MLWAASLVVLAAAKHRDAVHRRLSQTPDGCALYIAGPVVASKGNQVATVDSLQNYELSFTMELASDWSVVGTWQSVIHIGNTDGERFPGIWFEPNLPRLKVYQHYSASWYDHYSVGDVAPASGAFEAGETYDIKVVVESNQMAVYVDGVNRGTASGSATWYAADMGVYVGSGVSWWPTAKVTLSDICLKEIVYPSPAPVTPIPTLPRPTTPQSESCQRPSWGCLASYDVYTNTDCDGDGILDHMCTTTINSNRWLILSSEGCPQDWGTSSRAASECPTTGTQTGTFTFTGGDPGEGLDFTGDFVYAIDIKGPGGVTIDDAVFTSDGTSGFTVSAQYSNAAWKDRPNFGFSFNDAALELLMHSIRYSVSPTPMTVTMEVVEGNEYRLQLLFYEQCCYRGFDVLVDGVRIVDEFSPQIEQGGPTGSSRPGAAIYHEFVATGSTTTVTLDGISAAFGDTNPILNAVTLERIPGGDSFVSFVYVGQEMSWEDARAHCRANYHDLASIHSASENAEVDALCPNRCWIGGSDSAQEGTWTWSDGTAWDYENWYTPNNEPNNCCGGQDFLHIYGWDYAGRWDDTYEHLQPFICSTRPRGADEEDDDEDSDGGAAFVILCVVGALFPACGILYVFAKKYAAKSAKVAATTGVTAVPNAAADDGTTITVEAPPGRLGLEFEGTSAIVKEVLFDSPLVGKVHPGDVLKSVNGVAVTGGKCLTNAVAAADDGTNPRTLAAKATARAADATGDRRPHGHRGSGPRRRRLRSASGTGDARPPRHRHFGPGTLTLFLCGLMKNSNILNRFHLVRRSAASSSSPSCA